MKINNKGFTLIELLAVFVILLSVSLIAVSGITASLDKSEIKECVRQQELAVSAAKMYFSLDGKDETTVTVSTLKEKDYFNDRDNTDRLNDGDIIKVTDSGYTYNGKSAGESCN